MKRRVLSNAATVAGRCLCGAVRFEIDYPAFWAWHDHKRASRLAHGAAYATYVGSWRKRFRLTAGEREITRYEDKAAGAVRSFCRRCGTPLFYERSIPAHGQHPARAVREPHRPPAALSRGIDELQDWVYTGEPLVPLKGFPGIVWQRSRAGSEPTVRSVLTRFSSLAGGSPCMSGGRCTLTSLFFQDFA